MIVRSDQPQQRRSTALQPQVVSSHWRAVLCRRLELHNLLESKSNIDGLETDMGIEVSGP